MATVQAYTKTGVDAKFNSRSNMSLVHNGGGDPDISAYPDSKTGDTIERTSDGARWTVVASTINPIASRVMSVAGKTGAVTLGPGDVGAAPSSHTHTKAQITDLNASTSATANSIAQRGTGGVLVVGTPTTTTHAATKAYVDGRITGGITWANLSGKPSTFTPSTHTHTVSQVTDLTLATAATASTVVQRDTSGRVTVATPTSTGHATTKSYVDSAVTESKAWSAITGKPSTYAPSTHSHTQAQVTGLPAKLTTYDTVVNKVNSTVSSISGSTSDSGSLVALSTAGRLTAVNPASTTDVANKQYVDSEISAKTTWANTSGKPSTFPPSSHTHTVSQITDLAISQNSTGSSVVQRDSSGRVTISNPTSTGHATTKAYVDNAVTAAKAWTAITGKPSTFTPSTHNHTTSQITDLTIRDKVEGGTVPIRNENGSITLGEPTNATHATSKQYVDTAVTASKAWSAITGKPSTFAPSSHTHTISQITDLNISVGANASTIVQRTTTGQVGVSYTPEGPGNATSKQYVDDKFLPISLGTTNLNNIETTGYYFQPQNVNATTARNYPEGANAGHLFVLAGWGRTKQEYTDYKGEALYYRTKFSDIWYPWNSVTQERIT